MPETDREARILELRRLVEKGEYQIDGTQIAAALIRKSGQLDASEFPSAKPSEQSTFSKVEDGIAIAAKRGCV
jgi:hypothetical protein